MLQPAPVQGAGPAALQPSGDIGQAVPVPQCPSRRQHKPSLLPWATLSSGLSQPSRAQLGNPGVKSPGTAPHHCQALRIALFHPKVTARLQLN